MFIDYYRLLNLRLSMSEHSKPSCIGSLSCPHILKMPSHCGTGTNNFWGNARHFQHIPTMPLDKSHRMP